MCALRKDLWADQRGSALPLIIVVVTVLFGMVAFVVDAGLWRVQYNQLQREVDFAAIAAGQSLMNDDPLADVQIYLNTHAASSSFAPDLTLTASMPTSERVEISGTFQTSTFFAGIFGINPPLIRASAGVEAGGGAAPCLLALKSNPANNYGIRVTNSGSITVTDCDVYSNAIRSQTSSWTEDGSIYVRNGSIIAQEVCANGTAVASTNGTSVISPQANTSCGQFADPMADFPVPTPTGDTQVNPSSLGWWNGTKQLDPGIYPNGLVIDNGKKAMLGAGVYYITGGDFVTENGGILQPSNGVTIVMLSTGRVRFSDGSSVAHWRAPTSGTFDGIAFYRNPSLACPNGVKFDGATRFKYEGIMYFAGCDVEVSNNAVIETRNDYTYLIGDTFDVKGSAQINLKTDTVSGYATNFSGSSLKLVL